jgi:hypothetical protein
MKSLMPKNRYQNLLNLLLLPLFLTLFSGCSVKQITKDPFYDAEKVVEQNKGNVLHQSDSHDFPVKKLNKGASYKYRVNEERIGEYVVEYVYTHELDGRFYFDLTYDGKQRQRASTKLKDGRLDGLPRSDKIYGNCNKFTLGRCEYTSGSNGRKKIVDISFKAGIWNYISPSSGLSTVHIQTVYDKDGEVLYLSTEQTNPVREVPIDTYIVRIKD